MFRSLTRLEAPNRLRMLLALLAVATATAVLAACSSSGTSSSTTSTGGSSPVAATAGSLKTATIGGATVLTSAKGFTLYSFAPDTPTTSNCNGACAQNWPPVTGPTTAAGVTGSFGTIKRSDGAAQATFDGHPLYTFAGDTAPGQANGNGVNAFGGLWHEITTNQATQKPVAVAPSHAHSTPPAPVTTRPAPPATAPAHTASPIPQGNGGDHDGDNNGGPSDGDGNL